MTGHQMADPVEPTVTFDSYIIPETVRTFSRPNPGGVLNSAVLTGSMIALLTFALGVMVTLRFAGDAQEIVAVPFAATELPELLDASDSGEATEVTRLETADLLSPAAPPLQGAADVAALQAAVLKGLQTTPTIGYLTEEERAQKAVEAQTIVNRNKLRMLREAVLAGMYSVASPDGSGLMLKTLNTRMTEQNIASLLQQETALWGEGDISLPSDLDEEEASLDTQLFYLIQTSLDSDGTEEGAEAAREMQRRAYMATQARTRTLGGERVYLVQRGDNLEHISRKFYGDPDNYQRIFEANRDTLSTPDLIRIGQRLIIPG